MEEKIRSAYFAVNLDGIGPFVFVVMYNQRGITGHVGVRSTWPSPPNGVFFDFWIAPRHYDLFPEDKAGDLVRIAVANALSKGYFVKPPFDGRAQLDVDVDPWAGEPSRLS